MITSVMGDTEEIRGGIFFFMADSFQLIATHFNEPEVVSRGGCAPEMK